MINRTVLSSFVLSVFLSGFVLAAAVQQQGSGSREDRSNSSASGKQSLEELPLEFTSGDRLGIATPVDRWQETTTISGVKVDFRVVPSLKDAIVKRGPMTVSLNDINSAEMVESQPAVAQFRFTDATGTPLTGLRLAAWMDESLDKKGIGSEACQKKIQSFLQMQLSARPEVDLNTYYVLSLTQEPSILVIDPRLGFSSSKLYGIVDLPAPGTDWALNASNDRLFVTMPKAHQVAAIDAINFRLITNIDAGENPARAVLQPDGKYLWIGNDAREKTAESGVTVLDTTRLNVVARIPTGKGHHEIAFDEFRNAYVTNQDEGTVSIISIDKLARLHDLPVGKGPVSLGYSSVAKVMYAASRDGKVSAISSEKPVVIATFSENPGFSTLRISPDGHWGFVANEVENSVLVFDVATNQFKQIYGVGKSPDQLAFSDAYLYVRSRDSEEVRMIPLAYADKGEATPHFTSGQIAPGKMAAGMLASAIAPSLDGSSAFVANPADHRIYYYTEGMAAPMSSVEGYGKTPVSAMVLDRSIHETSPGIYSIGLRLPRAASYDVPLFVESPSLFHCFDFSVKVNPLLKKENQVAIQLHPLKNNQTVRTGEPVQLEFRLLDSQTQKPKAGIDDVLIMVLLTEGMRQTHLTAQSAGDGVYRAVFTPAKSGLYYATVQIPSLQIKPQQLPYLMFRAADQESSAAKTTGSSEIPAGKP